MAIRVTGVISLDPSNKKPTARPRSPRLLRASSQSAVLVKEEYTRWVYDCQWDCAGFLTLAGNFCTKHTKNFAFRIVHFLAQESLELLFYTLSERDLCIRDSSLLILILHTSAASPPMCAESKEEFGAAAPPRTPLPYALPL